MNEDEINTQTQTPTPPKNVVMGIIIFLSVIGVAVGSLSLVRSVHSPFAPDQTVSAVAQVDMTEQMQTAMRMESLKSQDSDEDTISDFDELYVYQTSPYLKDTDSDGFDDKTEIATNHDPNCPDGQNCFRQDLTTKTEGGLAGELPGVVSNVGVTATDQALLSASVDPTPNELRSMLREQGMTDQEIAQFDDATLLQTYKETIANTKSSPVSPAPLANIPSSGNGAVGMSEISGTDTKASSTINTDYSQYTPAQIRDLVRASGLIPEAQLSLIDDATLKDLFLKAVANSSNQ
ncbi:MAG: hypothetical protein Q8P11_00315 [bacterium]|nr:hypothetical protein [bacterium]